MNASDGAPERYEVLDCDGLRLPVHPSAQSGGVSSSVEHSRLPISSLRSSFQQRRHAHRNGPHRSARSLAHASRDRDPVCIAVPGGKRRGGDAKGTAVQEEEEDDEDDDDDDKDDRDEKTESVSPMSGATSMTRSTTTDRQLPPIRPTSPDSRIHDRGVTRRCPRACCIRRARRCWRLPSLRRD
jgi:hypothetical protein